MAWKLVTEDRYDEMLGVVPPLDWVSKGFLVGEQWCDKECSVIALPSPAYTAFVSYMGRFYENDEPMTRREWRAFDPHTARLPVPE